MNCIVDDPSIRHGMSMSPTKKKLMMMMMMMVMMVMMMMMMMMTMMFPVCFWKVVAAR